MLNRFIRAAHEFALKQANRSAEWTVFVRDTARGIVTTAHHTVMILGLAAISTLAMMFVRPDIANQIKNLFPFSVTMTTGREIATPLMGNFAEKPSATFEPTSATNMRSTVEQGSKPVDTARQQQWVTNWLSKRYHVAGDATDMLVSAAYQTAKETKLDPLLILAVVAVESGFNPFAESAVGAQGLMQVMSKLHHEKFEYLGGVKAALDPVANIKVGSLILKDYVMRGGSLEAGLKLYVGAAAHDTDSGYGARVLAEYNRLKQVATGKRVPVFATTAAAQTQKNPLTNVSVIDRKAEAGNNAESTSSALKYLSKFETEKIAAL